jgi:hypothetical protein
MPSIINATTSTGLVSSADNSGSLQLATNSGTTALTINTSQNMGVGITSPTARLHVYGGSNNQFKVESSGAEANFTLAGTSYGQINNSVGDWYLTNDASANMIFRTASTERMRITSAGEMLVGTTTDPASGGLGVLITGTQSANFWASRCNTTNGYGHMTYYNPNGYRGEIATNGTNLLFVNASDYRLKENVAPMTGALAKVTQLKPCTYTWKSDGSSGQGFIAHELQAVVPDCVTGEKDAVETYTDEDGNEQTRIKPQGVDTSFLVATLTAAIQELKAELDATKAEVAALKGVA